MPGKSTDSVMDTSFEDGEGTTDVASVMAEFNGESVEDSTTLLDYAAKMHVKKLSELFEGCVRSDSNQMKVYLRVRPTSKAAEPTTIQINSATTITTIAPDSSKRAQYTKMEERNYMFSGVFGPQSNQDKIFSDVGKPLLDRFLRGESCVLFAYGMTNSGKTFTIQGTQTEPGILPHLVEDVLRAITSSTAIPTTHQNQTLANCDLSVSMLEIYQEKVYDLLSKRRDKLTIRDGNGHVEVVKLTSTSIASSYEAVKLMDTAALNRSKAHTLLNSGSSRSHAVYTLTLKQRGSSQPYSTFHVVDLAGAERCNRTKASFMQLKEANNINVSLMQLWRCLQGMKKKVADGTSSGMDMIPYRESKLTHLLMPELGRAGVAGVAMITCVNPQMDDYDETISILGNASIACKITELADIGRPAVPASAAPTPAPHQSMISSIFHHLNPVSAYSSSSSSAAAEKAATAAADKAAQANKRKREKVSSETSEPLAPASVPATVAPKRTGFLRTAVKAQVAAATVTRSHRSNSSSSNATVASISSIATAATAGSIVVDDEDVQEIKRLRLEISRLEQENHSLLSDTMQRETDIRSEVANEMAKRSNTLLAQIQRLQTQLKHQSHDKSDDEDEDSNENGTSHEETARNRDNSKEYLLRSCKKVKRKHMEKEHEEARHDLIVIEEEYERLKAKYEEEVGQLRGNKQNLLVQVATLEDENKRLTDEVSEWMARAHAAAKQLDELQVKVGQDLSPVSSRASYQTLSLVPDETEDTTSVSEQSQGKRSKKSSTSGAAAGKGKAKKASIREQLTAGLAPEPAVEVSLKSEASAFYNRMQSRNGSMVSSAAPAPTSGKRSPLSSISKNQHLFPPASAPRAASPQRARSPLTSPSNKRSVSPSSAQNKAPFVVKKQGSDSNDENNGVAVFGQVKAKTASTVPLEGAGADGATYFRRLRSQFAGRA